MTHCVLLSGYTRLHPHEHADMVKGQTAGESAGIHMYTESSVDLY